MGEDGERHAWRVSRSDEFPGIRPCRERRARRSRTCGGQHSFLRFRQPGAVGRRGGCMAGALERWDVRKAEEGNGKLCK